MAQTSMRDLAQWNKRQVVTADKDGLDPSIGFLVDATGTLSCRFRAESALADLPVVVGEVYYGDLDQIDITDSTSVTAVTLLRKALV